MAFNTLDKREVVLAMKLMTEADGIQSIISIHHFILSEKSWL